MNDIPKALKAYHRAVEVGEDTEQTLLQGMTYGQMGILFAYQELYDDSRSIMRKALRCYGELGDSVRYANTLATLAPVSYTHLDVYKRQIFCNTEIFQEVLS